MGEGIGVDDALDGRLSDAWQVGSLDQSINCAQTLKRFFDSGVGKISAPEDLVAVMDGVFLGANQNIVGTATADRTAPTPRNIHSAACAR